MASSSIRGLRRGRADQDRRDLVGRLRVAELLAPAFEDLARVGAERVWLEIRHVRQPLLVEALMLCG